jgi:hypothetical protein
VARVGAIRIAGQNARLDERTHALLEEERVALGPLDQEWLQRSEARIVTEQRAQQLGCARLGQGIDAQLAVVGLAAPVWLYSGR